MYHHAYWWCGNDVPKSMPFHHQMMIETISKILSSTRNKPQIIFRGLKPKFAMVTRTEEQLSQF